MNLLIFLLISIICMGILYLIHKYFGKEEFYLAAIIYSVISFLLSFKIIKLFGLNINCSIIFSSSLIAILYYFINKYASKEVKKLITLIMISTIGSIIFMIFSSVTLPIVDDAISNYYQDLVFNNIPAIIFYPLSLFITLCISKYCFEELKLEKRYKLLKMIFTIIGIMFIDVFIFDYFNYAFLIHFDKALLIALDNYLVKTIIMVIFIILTMRLLNVKKVKK